MNVNFFKFTYLLSYCMCVCARACACACMCVCDKGCVLLLQQLNFSTHQPMPSLLLTWSFHRLLAMTYRPVSKPCTRSANLCHFTSESCALHQLPSRPVFTVRCYASAVLAMALCPSVCPSQVGVLLKWLNVGSHKQQHTIAQGLKFSDAKDLREIRPGSPPTGAPNTGAVGQNRRLSTNSWLYLENGTR